jgi:hypothetical protein
MIGWFLCSYCCRDYYTNDADCNPDPAYTLVHYDSSVSLRPTLRFRD